MSSGFVSLLYLFVSDIDFDCLHTQCPLPHQSAGQTTKRLGREKETAQSKHPRPFSRLTEHNVYNFYIVGRKMQDVTAGG